MLFLYRLKFKSVYGLLHIRRFAVLGELTKLGTVIEFKCPKDMFLILVLTETLYCREM